MILAYFEGSICMIIHDVPKIISMYDDIQGFTSTRRGLSWLPHAWFRSGWSGSSTPAVPALSTFRPLPCFRSRCELSRDTHRDVGLVVGR